MRSALPLLAFCASLLCPPVAMALNEYGIEGMGVVSTRANEGRASISPDGQRIVWASDRTGARAGWNLWQARLHEGRWQQPEALAVNSDEDDLDPYFSRDGRWLLFASRRGGTLALYRVPVSADGQLGSVQPLAGPGADTAAERAPALSVDGRWLLFSRQSGSGTGYQLQVAPLQQGRRGPAQTLTALDTAADELHADWLPGGAVVFSRGQGDTAQVWTSRCAWTGAGQQPLPLSFNQATGWTGTPVIDNAKPAEMLLASSAARAPRAGGVDVYRMAVPALPAEVPCAPPVPAGAP